MIQKTEVFGLWGRNTARNVLVKKLRKLNISACVTKSTIVQWILMLD